MINLHPTFKKYLWFIRAIFLLILPPFWLIGNFVGTLILGPFIKGGLKEEYNILVLIIGYYVFVCISLFVLRNVYNRITINITQTSIAHSFNFLWNKKKQIIFSNIKEVELKVGFLQRFFGLGTIIIYTQANANKPGLFLFDIKDPEKVYDLLLQGQLKETEKNSMLRML